MAYSEIDYQRRCAVEKAWSNERRQVMKSHGSRNWAQAEQREILATGKCHHCHGHHMLNVKSYPQYAGNEKNIQFLTPKEHFDAHRGNWKNTTNGRYNLRTRRTVSSEGEIPKISYRKLTKPLSDGEKQTAIESYERRKATVSKQSIKSSETTKTRKRLPVRKTNNASNSDKRNSGKKLFNNKANTGVSKSVKPTVTNGGKTSNATHSNTGISMGKGNGMGR